MLSAVAGSSVMRRSRLGVDDGEDIGNEKLKMKNETMVGDAAIRAGRRALD
jgi:hypothetical protein